jgi:hypothetical protein
LPPKTTRCSPGLCSPPGSSPNSPSPIDGGGPKASDLLARRRIQPHLAHGPEPARPTWRTEVPSLALRPSPSFPRVRDTLLHEDPSKESGGVLPVDTEASTGLPTLMGFLTSKIDRRAFLSFGP